MKIPSVNRAGTMLVKGTFEQQEALQKVLQAKKMNFEFTLHGNYTPTEDMVYLYAFGKKEVKGMQKYLAEQRKKFGYNPLKRDRLVTRTITSRDYNEFADLIASRIKHYGLRISEFVAIPEKTVPIGIVAGSIQMNYFQKLRSVLAAKTSKPLNAMA